MSPKRQLFHFFCSFVIIIVVFEALWLNQHYSSRLSISINRRKSERKKNKMKKASFTRVYLSAYNSNRVLQIAKIESNMEMRGSCVYGRMYDQLNEIRLLVINKKSYFCLSFAHIHTHSLHFYFYFARVVDFHPLSFCSIYYHCVDS